MKVLGIGCYYHDSSACLMIDGRVAAAAAEERFTRIKHDTSFPRNATGYCMKSAGVETVDKVVFYEKPLLKLERVLVGLYHGRWSFFPKLLHIPQEHERIPHSVIVGNGSIVGSLGAPEIIGMIASSSMEVGKDDVAPGSKIK